MEEQQLNQAIVKCTQELADLLADLKVNLLYAAKLQLDSVETLIDDLQVQGFDAQPMIDPMLARNVDRCSTLFNAKKAELKVLLSLKQDSAGS